MTSIQIIPIIVAALTGGLAGAVFSSLFIICRDKCNRRRTFRGYVKSVRAELMALDVTETRGEELAQRHKISIKGVRRACCDVSDDISAPRFQRAWEAYCGMTKAQVAAQQPIKDTGEVFKGLAPHYDVSRENMVKLLGELIDCAE